MKTQHNSRPSKWRGNQHRPYAPRPIVSMESAFILAEKQRRAKGVDVTQLVANISLAIREAQAKRHEEALDLIS